LTAIGYQSIFLLVSWTDNRYSKFLSLILRHDPQRIGLTIDDQGWVNIDALLEAANRHRVPLTRELLEVVVAENSKQRFTISEDGLRIRANQGHSLPLDLGLPAIEPPELLYHGTADRFVNAIRREGLMSRKRNHVHLSPDAETAEAVGRRHGRPVVLTIKAGDMFRVGYDFFLAANGVWLTAHVPAEHIIVASLPE
jgi:putative RNA 2'-phosphotransferase